MRRFGTACLLAAALGASAPARADSQMHQSPLLERGSDEACADLRAGRRQRGAYAWQFGCPDVPRVDNRRR